MVALVVVLEGWSATVKREKVLILTSVNVVDVRAGVVLPKMTVVVRDGKIDAVAKGEFVSHEPGAQVVDATGKYLIPGLWDMHVHSAGGPAAPWDEKVILPLYIANGITGVRDMGGDLDLLQKRRSKIETGELVGPAMVFGGPFLEGGKAQDFTIPINTPEEARQAVDTLERRDVDFIKVLSNVPREAYFAVAEEARKKKLPFVGHVPESVSASEASEAGQRSMEHAADVLLACSSKETELRRRRSEAREQNDGKAYTAAGQEILATYAAGKARSLFAEFVKNDTWQVPTLVWWDATSRLREASLADARLRFVPGWARKEWDPEKLKREITPEHGAALQKATASYIELVREMHRVGVPILAGTDSPDPFVFPGFSLHEELELLVQAGLTPAGALRAATLAPMEFLQRSDRGVVEKGRVADLVLLDGDPLQDIRNTRKIMGVIVGGRYFSRKDLNQMLAQTEASAEAE
jgi:hypothetical protein